uniref:Uncharacterized protein n=1 Tax=Onchocerca volvulus TaxID=6282 RepID=A0A8R1Y195_ONCVO
MIYSPQKPGIRIVRSIYGKSDVPDDDLNRKQQIDVIDEFYDDMLRSSTHGKLKRKSLSDQLKNSAKIIVLLCAIC